MKLGSRLIHMRENRKCREWNEKRCWATSVGFCCLTLFCGWTLGKAGGGEGEWEDIGINWAGVALLPGMISLHLTVALWRRLHCSHFPEEESRNAPCLGLGSAPGLAGRIVKAIPLSAYGLLCPVPLPQLPGAGVIREALAWLHFRLLIFLFLCLFPPFHLSK